MDKDEENYFGNFQTKKAKTDKDKINLNIEHDIKKKKKTK